MNEDYPDWAIVNRSNGITYKFNAKEIYFGNRKSSPFVLYIIILAYFSISNANILA